MTSNTPASGRSAGFAVAIVLIGIVWLGIARPDARPMALMRDFSAFYCAGRALAQHADPYRAEPLGACERQPKPLPLLSGTPGLAMPAPLPPYALLPFVALARLPYGIAAILWGACIVLSVGVAIAALRRATGAPLIALVAAFALTDGYASLCLGQVAPIAVAAIALAALFLREHRDEAAALSAAFAMIEPHVGLPACVALFVWRRRTRVVLLAVAIACVLSSVAVAGFATTIEYVRAVIPAHALSEVVNEKQFSLTYLLHRFGVPVALAVRAGAIWYLAMLIAGVVCARSVVKRTCDGAALAAIPPAFALLGGPFVHIIQMSAALPAAFILYVHADSRRRPAIGLAIVLLAIPWIQFMNLGTIFALLVPFVAAILIATLVDARPLTVGSGAILTLVFLGLVVNLVTTGIGDATPGLLAHYDPHALAEASWERYVRTIGTANVPAFDLAKLPTMLGLGTLLGIAVATTLRPLETTPGRTLDLPNRKEAGGSWRIAYMLTRPALRARARRSQKELQP